MFYFGMVLRFASRLGWGWWTTACVVGVAVAVVYYHAVRRLGLANVRPFPVGLLAAYITIVLAFTVLSRKPVVLEKPLNLDAIGAIVSRLGFKSRRYEILFNIALFVPIGLLLSLVTGARPLHLVLLCTLFSIGIELARLLKSCGTCELSDVLCNMVGAGVGVGLGALLDRYSAIHHVEKKSGAHANR